MPAHLLITPAAAALVRRLKDQYGPLIFHQSGGCCEGSAPMCFRQGEFRVGARDVLLGMIEDCLFYIGGAAFGYWAQSQLTIAVTSGGGDSFSLEALEGVRFVTRSRLFTAAEAAELEAAGPPLTEPEVWADGTGSMSAKRTGYRDGK